MRKLLPIVLLSILASVSCTQIDCPLNNTVLLKLSLTNGSGIVSDTLNISGLRHDGSDTLIVNRLTGQASAWIPVSYAGSEDILVLCHKDTNDVETLDTLRVGKTNQPHFESVDCSPSYFHEITALSTTHNGIDSAVITNPYVDYDTTKTHVTIYYKAGY